MRTILRLVGIAFLVGAAAAGFWLYQLVWGLPFNFDHLVDRQAVYFLISRPQTLTALGIIDGTWLDYHSDKLDDFGVAERDRLYAQSKRNLADVRSYDRAGLTPQQRTTYDIMAWWLDSSLRLQRFPWLASGGSPYPMDQLNGEQTQLPRFMQFSHQVFNEKTARNYVARLKAFGHYFDQVLGEVDRQASLGVIPPRFVVDHVIAGAAAFIAPEPKDHPLVTTLRDKLAKIGDLAPAVAQDLESAAIGAMKDVVYPSYDRTKTTFGRLKAKATDDDGVWRLPDGAAYYAEMLRQNTTTDITPEAVHALGLAEVARLEAEIDGLLKSVGLENSTLVARMDRLSSDPRFVFPSSDLGREKILEGYRELLERMEKRLPEYFSHVPPQRLEVKRVPPYAEATSPGAYYNPPTLDGRQPGTFFANVREPAETASWQMPTLAYHEGIPGHHLQTAWAQNIENVPIARRVLPFTAYGEGWALYAEHLAKDMGVYDNDPYGDLGRLQAEMFRAVRLVVDTGIHAKRWTRKKAIDYMRANTGMALSEVTSEVERYIVNPGQACAYKIGMLKILELRERAKTALGAAFSLEDFHDVILGGGAMPLTILEQRVDEWIATRKVATRTMQKRLIPTD